jgi:DNA mismatch repair ATPase MutS
VDDPAQNVVTNSIELSDNKTFAILNGPNKGGKTTFIQAMAINIILFQLGLYSTCRRATITPVDNILTHYQRDEHGTLAGRLEKEMNSIRKIFSNLTKKSLVFFNEPYVSTNPSEGMELIFEVLKAVSIVGCRGLLVTHYHQINDSIEKHNKNAMSEILFMNMGIGGSGMSRKRTYELKKGRGEVKSFAEDILREYAPEILD